MVHWLTNVSRLKKGLYNECLSDNICLQSAEAIPTWTNQKPDFFLGKEVPPNLSADQEDIAFFYFVSDANHSLNLGLTFQTKQFSANLSLNSGHNIFPFHV